MDASQRKQQVSTTDLNAIGKDPGQRAKVKIQKNKTSERSVFLGDRKRWDPWGGGRWDWPKRGGLAHLVQ